MRPQVRTCNPGRSQQLGIDPADPASCDRVLSDHLQNLRIRHQRRGRQREQIRDDGVGAPTKAPEEQLAEHPWVEQDQVVVQQRRDLGGPGPAAQVVDPDRGVDEDQTDLAERAGRRRRGARAEGMVPRRAARRRRAAWATMACSASSMARVLLSVPSAACAAASSSGSMFSVVRMQMSMHT